MRIGQEARAQEAQEVRRRSYTIALEPGAPGLDDRHRSPSLGALAIVFDALFLASIAAYGLSNGPGGTRLVAFLQFGAAIPLGLFTASIVSRLLFHRINVAGVHIAFFGGLAASLFMGISALTVWTTTQAQIADDAGAVRVLSQFVFATGGFGHTAALGLLLAGVSVPSLLLDLMPRWVGWLGLIVAAICELSTLGILWPAALPLLPIARFPALVWLVAAGFTMPAVRNQARAAEAAA